MNQDLLLTPVAYEVVTLVEAKAHLKIDGTDEDGLLPLYISAACRSVEVFTGVALGTQARVWTVETDAAEAFHYVPVTAVSKVEYFTGAGYDDYTAQTDRYSVEGERFEPLMSGKWKVSYECGYTTENVPANLKLAVLHQVAFLYENRGETTGVNSTAKMLASPFKRFFGI